ncbi:MAG: hypothetical protein M1821_009125 [Bathelium mastoideum]|nr:MAG: hypothetical protein M1821_009125 [Bathelium mastoideum]
MAYSQDDFMTDRKALRSAEVEETVELLHKLQNGHGHDIYKLNSRNEGSISLSGFQKRLDLTNIIIAGHSAGATLAMQTLSPSPNPKLPFKGAIILDPGKRSGKLNEDIRVPTLIANSGSWSREIGHFNRVKNLTQQLMRDHLTPKAWFMTLLDTAHPSVTDAPLIEPWLLNFATGATLDVHAALKAYVDISDDFIRLVVSDRNEVLGVLGRAANDPDGEVVRGEREAHMDLTDPDERERVRNDLHSIEVLRQRHEGGGKGAAKISEEVRWAVHVAPTITPISAPENGD